jgi:ketosteroid isomerase-like protein
MFLFFYSRDIVRPYVVDDCRFTNAGAQMVRTALLAATLCAALVIGAGARSADDTLAHDVIVLERAALDRWGNGDPQGFLDTYSQDITYFDIGTERRLDGHAALGDYYRPLTGKIKIPRYEMLNPRVQRHGEVAVLTYNLVSEAVQPDGKQATVRWNSTSVYARTGRRWQMIHSHWSLTAAPCLRGIV